MVMKLRRIGGLLDAVLEQRHGLLIISSLVHYPGKRVSYRGQVRHEGFRLLRSPQGNVKILTLLSIHPSHVRIGDSEVRVGFKGLSVILTCSAQVFLVQI